MTLDTFLTALVGGLAGGATSGVLVVLFLLYRERQRNRDTREAIQAFDAALDRVMTEERAERERRAVAQGAAIVGVVQERRAVGLPLVRRTVGRD